MGLNYQQRQKLHDRAVFEAGMRTGAQLVADFMTMSLRDPNVMTKYRVLSPETLDKVFENCSKLDEHFSLAFSDDVEADYVREEWDGVLRETYGDKTHPFDVRFPYAREIKYLKPRKGWI